MNTVFLLVLTIAEIALLVLVLVFFIRLRRSEHILSQLQANQDDLLDRMIRNAELEQEMVATFAQRQEQLAQLNLRLEDRAQTLKRLLEQAEGISRSPHFLREVILNCKKKGQTTEQIARKTGLARDEIELILAREQS